MPPHGLAAAPAVRGHDFIVAPLFLRVDEIAVDREGRPAGPDWMTPQFDGRRFAPVGFDAHAANDAVAFGSTEARPLGNVCVRGRRRWRWGGRFVRERFAGCFD